MKTYSKSQLARDSRGFYRYLGGRRFRFASLEAGKIAVPRLEALFARCGGWDDLTLTLANAIREGKHEVVVPLTINRPDGKINPLAEVIDYAGQINRLNQAFGDLIRIVPKRQEIYIVGEPELQAKRDEELARVNRNYPQSSHTQSLAHETLHQAIDSYCVNLASQYETPWGRVKLGQAQRLKAFEDMPLSRLTLEKMQAQLVYWAKRPKVKNKDKRISLHTARNQIRETKDFWKWLHRSDSYSWKRPEGWEDLKPNILKFPTDQKAFVEVFTVEDLAILYRHASPLMRLFVLLGLNCGFSIAEISTLSPDEIRLTTRHSRYPLDGSWIMRIRHKSGVYGEFALWPETADALQWAMARKPALGKFLLTTKNGKPYHEQTVSGSKSARIPNQWRNLYKTARRHVADLRWLPFKHLRKTAAQLVRQISDGETAGVFLCHGTPVKSDSLADVYSNRDFTKVFDALTKVRAMLEPLFRQ